MLTMGRAPCTPRHLVLHSKGFRNNYLLEMTGLPIDNDREIAKEGFRVGHKRRVRLPLGVFLPPADPVLYQSSRDWSSKEHFSNRGHNIGVSNVDSH